MKLITIAAVGKNRELGKDNDLIWHIKEDLQYFKKVTTGKNILMGKNTFNSLGRLLPNRHHIIISTSLSIDNPEVEVFRSLEDFLGKTLSYPDMDKKMYKARWSTKPFVYISVESLKPMKSGNYTVTCYSNCKRLALYSDGKLFEFQHGQEIFTFQEIPVKGPCIMLAVEGEGCSVSLSVQRSRFRLDRATVESEHPCHFKNVH